MVADVDVYFSMTENKKKGMVEYLDIYISSGSKRKFRYDT
jgi:hypothetical protein